MLRLHRAESLAIRFLKAVTEMVVNGGWIPGVAPDLVSELSKEAGHRVRRYDRDHQCENRCEVGLSRARHDGQRASGTGGRQSINEDVAMAGDSSCVEMTGEQVARTGRCWLAAQADTLVRPTGVRPARRQLTP